MTKSEPATTLPAESRSSFSQFLRSQRETKELSLDEIARTTRIPVRSLEHLESGQFEKLPGDVFVRGFLKSYARCVGLDATDAVKRYARCGLDPAPVCSEMADEILRNTPAEPADPSVLLLSTPKSQSNSANASAGKGRRRLARGTVTPQEAVEVASTDDSHASAVDRIAKATASTVKKTSEVRDGAPVAKRAGVVAARALTDLFGRVKNATRDARPRDNQDEHEARAVVERQNSEKPARARSFLPPMLLDQEPETSRGGLTLAVIILVVVASLAMSYLLRRPSQSGDGVTSVETQQSVGQRV